MANNLIIFVEDDPEQRDYFKMVLEAHGYQVVLAENSANILELVAEYDPVLVLTDLVMPEHDGIEGIFKMLKNHTIPIIAISVYSKYLDTVRAIVTASILKPVSDENFIGVIKDVIKKAS